MTAIEQLEKLATRFAGVDVQCRNAWQSIGWNGLWRAVNVANKNERDDYRLTVYGDTLEQAVERLLAAVQRVDELNRSERGRQ